MPHKVLRYESDRAISGYGIDASEQLGVPAQRVFKTLVAETDAHELIVACVPVSGRLHMKSLATAAGAKKAFMAEGAQVEKTTGYVLGGVSPLGQKKALRSFIDVSAQDFDTIFVSGGRRGLEIELAPATLATLTQATFAPLNDS
ncbi:Cys-tRNA(Pro) deacylase [Salinisphaera aquimarina]